ncbi:MAG: 50S ribosomal protein L20 [Deltaproteobacteria bacterium]|nr:50S ribosomal protein L20 [Deltaproteobacteria bacterium]
MSRTKGGVKTRKRHKRVLKAARGFYAGRRKYFTAAKETLDRAMAYAFAGRKIKKRDYRAMWNARINAGLRPHGISYSRFISALKTLKIELDRKVLADLATRGTKGFTELIALAKDVEDKRKASIKKAA